MDSEQENLFKNAQVYYLYDSDKKLTTSTVVYDGKTPENGTTIEPFKLVNGVKILMTNPTFDTTKQVWIESKIATQPSAEHQLLMQQGQQITLLQTTVMQQNQANAKLQANNQQQEKQIKQLQQMFMQANQQQAITKPKEEAQQ